MLDGNNQGRDTYFTIHNTPLQVLGGGRSLDVRCHWGDTGAGDVHGRELQVGQEPFEPLETLPILSTMQQQRTTTSGSSSSSATTTTDEVCVIAAQAKADSSMLGVTLVAKGRATLHKLATCGSVVEWACTHSVASCRLLPLPTLPLAG